MNLGPHAAFIMAAYVAAVIVIGGLITWVMVDYRAQQRLLGELDAQGVAKGVTRRSGAAKEVA